MEICIWGKEYKIGKKQLLFVAALVLVYVVIGNPFSKPEANVEEEPLEVIHTSRPIEEKVETVQVYVSGRVKKPGVYEIEKGAIISEALDMAGGIKKGTRMNLNLAYQLNSNVQICVKRKNSFINLDATTGEASSGMSETGNSRINLNTADAEALMEIPGVGEATAKKIIDYRTENGFKQIEDLMNVSGIGEKKFEDMKEYVII